MVSYLSGLVPSVWGYAEGWQLFQQHNILISEFWRALWSFLLANMSCFANRTTKAAKAIILSRIQIFSHCQDRQIRGHSGTVLFHEKKDSDLDKLWELWGFLLSIYKDEWIIINIHCPLLQLVYQKQSKYSTLQTFGEIVSWSVILKFSDW